MKDIFQQSDDANVLVPLLRKSSVCIPNWGDLLKAYEPSNHEVVNDTDRIRDRKLANGNIEKASRITLGLEKLLVSRYVDFTFAIPVRRIYHIDEKNAKHKEIQNALEAMYKYARIDTENIKRARAYYAACEYCTVWYTVKQDNTLYGFKSGYKLKCKTYSPMEGVKLYPLFDEYGDMKAMSFEYTQKVDNTDVTYFETYTATAHYKWKQSGKGWVTEELDKDVTVLTNALGKIPAVYSYRPKPVYEGLTGLRSEMEYALSRNSNIISYNAAPAVKIAGGIAGEEKKDEGYRIFRVESGGDVSYISWNQSIDALKYQIDNLLKFYFMQAQMPDISADRMMSLGNIGYDARQTILMDSHLKIGEESGAWIEALERETNVLKAFLKLMRTDLAKDVDNVDVEHVITPFIQNDEKSEIQKWQTACGKPVMSQLSAIQNLGYAANAQEELAQIQKEEAAAQASKMSSLFGSAEGSGNE